MPIIQLCAADCELLHGFEPDMGDDIPFETGVCDYCKRSMIVFDIEVDDRSDDVESL